MAAAPVLTCFLFCMLLPSHDPAQAKKMLSGSLVDASSSRRREVAEARTTTHDVFAPVTNTVTVPATNPATDPASPGIVTVPSTNPGTGYATNPNLPPLYPEPTPISMPDPTAMPSSVMTPAPFTNPVAAPTTTVTNPATTPTALPGSSPVTNPATAYPYPPQGQGGAGAGVGGGGMPTTPVYAPPTTMPGTVQPAAPTTVSGQAWCVAKTGLTDLALQNGLDYACGIGGADCSALQPMGSCYNPTSLQAHASYAFNSYFQKNPSPTSCDFGGAGMLVSTNPSSGTCIYQTSSSSSGFSAGNSPAVTGTSPVGLTPGYGPVGTTNGMGTGPAVSGGSGSTVLNANNYPGGNSMYGSDSPSGYGSGAASLSCGWILSLIWIFTFACVKEKV